MKKVFSLILALALALAVTASLAETADDKSFVITLTANPTTGYEWKYAANDEVVTVEETFLTAEDIDKLAGEQPSEELMSGAGGLSVFTVKGVKPGETVIALEYAQSWDDDSTEVGLTYFLRVNDDLSVVCVGATAGL